MHLTVFSRRWGHDDRYTINRTSTGWSVRFSIIGGEADPTGSPSLFDNLRHDSINYPAALGEYMKWLWDASRDGNMTDDKIQANLDRIGEWISKTEKATPDGIFSALG